ncbi:hypothetical protein RDI58_021819 [Solanum bulbocastanum]|uniref:Reverse transcriptase n=1 Tax=Solanum bulbocastanum TaxID=147425 RepID=A0AAN8Y4P3_SOLBU
MNPILDNIEEKITANQNGSLIRLFTIDDVKEVILSMHSDKAPVCKMLANRMKSCLDDCVAEAKSAFIPGSFILDNVMISFEVNHYLIHKTHGKTGFVTLKTDMSKAYDR